MNEKMWYYVKENKQEGPIPQSKMQEMFDTGILDVETLVWSETLSEWTPASKVDSFRLRVIPSPPPLPKQEPPPIPSFGPTQKTQEKDVSQVRPWVRYWARMFDIYFFSLPAGFVLGIIAPSVLKIPEIFLGMLVIFIWILVESSLLSTWGTTPGKWLLKTTLRDSTGGKLSFSSALTRSFSVWGRGLGIGFPIASLITLIIAHNSLLKEGITSWDREGSFVISHNRIGPIRIIVLILFFIGFIGFLIAINMG